jgi:diguanylate cyclase (GGDEF)-like protein
MQRNRPLDTAAWRWVFESGSLFRGEVSPLSVFKAEKGAFDKTFQALLSEANQELATLLREVHTKSDAAPRSTPQSQPISGLLMRAVACAVKQYMLRAELSNLAFTDELTGLYNRRGFLPLTERQTKLGRRSGREMLLFFIDVDGLKRINDSFGHSEGDLALIRTAEVLGRTFRDSDVLARLGGDEFAALAIEASGHSEATITTRLRGNLETVSINESRYLLSLSLGVVRFDPRTTRSIAQLMLQADRAMYEAKRHHRRSAEQTRSLIVRCHTQRCSPRNNLEGSILKWPRGPDVLTKEST